MRFDSLSLVLGMFAICGPVSLGSDWIPPANRDPQASPSPHFGASTCSKPQASAFWNKANIRLHAFSAWSLL